MASVNKAIIIGNLGSDPEVRYGQSGNAVCNFRIATNETWKDKEGKKQERVEWHRIVVFGRQAETCGEYLQKGRSVYIEGRIQTREWEDKEGQRRYTTEINADRVQFLGGKGEGSGSSGGGYGAGGYGGGNSGGFGGGYGSNAPQVDDNDIPF